MDMGFNNLKIMTNILEIMFLVNFMGKVILF